MYTSVSYLVPSYNHARYLPTLLKSILLDVEKLNVSAEVIIIDDGSTDETASLLHSWVHTNTDKLEITFLAQENKGLGAVLNRLIGLAKGEYLRLCASDDVIVAGSTQVFYDAFRNNPDMICALGNAQVIDAEGAVIHESSINYHGGHTEYLEKPDYIVKELIQNWCIAGPSHLIRKSHYQTMRYDETLPIDDYDLFLSLLKIPNAIVYINTIVCLYRIHTTNTSKTKDVSHRVKNIQSFLYIINKYIDSGSLINQLLPVKYKTLAKIYFLQRNYIKCSYNMLLSLFFKARGEWTC